MLAMLENPPGRYLLRQARDAAIALCRSSLISGGLGGTRVWVDISLLGPNGASSLLEVYIDGGVLAAASDGAEDSQELMHRRRRRSARIGFSVKDAELLGDQALANETAEPGNVVRDLTPDGTYKLIVSAGGLSDDGCELVSELFALAVLVQLPALVRTNANPGEALMAETSTT